MDEVTARIDLMVQPHHFLPSVKHGFIAGFGYAGSGVEVLLGSGVGTARVWSGGTARV